MPDGYLLLRVWTEKVDDESHCGALPGQVIQEVDVKLLILWIQFRRQTDDQSLNSALLRLRVLASFLLCSPSSANICLCSVNLSSPTSSMIRDPGFAECALPGDGRASSSEM